MSNINHRAWPAVGGSVRPVLVAAAVAAVALGMTACGSAAPHAHSSGSSGTAAGSGASSLAVDVASLSAATQAQIDRAAVTTADVSAQTMGVTATDPDDAIVSKASQRIQPTACQPLMDVWQDGSPDYKAVASTEVSVLEAHATVESSHSLHLSSYSGRDALAFMSAISSALKDCHTYQQPDAEGTIRQTITPITVNAGDQSVAWSTPMVNGSQTIFATVTVVRVGSTLITGVELSNKVTSATALPPTNTFLLDTQVNKIRSVIG